MRLPVRLRPRGIQYLHVADRLIQGSEAQRCKMFSDLLGDELEEVDHELRLP